MNVCTKAHIWDNRKCVHCENKMLREVLQDLRQGLEEWGVVRGFRSYDELLEIARQALTKEVD